MEKDSLSGLMALSSKGSGQMTKPMDWDIFFILMETFLKGLGSTIKLTAKEFTKVSSESAIQASGSMIFNMDMVSKDGLKARLTMESIKMAKSTASES